MDTQKKLRVHVSALCDDAVGADDLELALAALQSPDGQLAWQTYYRIGDALRAQATPELSEGFAAALAARLDAEPPLNRRTRSAEVGTNKRGMTRAGTAARKRSRSTPPLARTAAAQANAADASGELPTDAKAVVEPKPAVASVS